LGLFDNQLSGEIPYEIGDLVNLIELNLQKNQLRGEIPPEMGNLTNLTSLYLNDNKLRGKVPSDIETLTSLTKGRKIKVNLSNNEFYSVEGRYTYYSNYYGGMTYTVHIYKDNEWRFSERMTGYSDSYDQNFRGTVIGTVLFGYDKDKQKHVKIGKVFDLDSSEPYVKFYDWYPQRKYRKN